MESNLNTIIDLMVSKQLTFKPLSFGHPINEKMEFGTPDHRVYLFNGLKIPQISAEN